MSTQYMTLLVHDVERTPLDVAGSVGLVLGVATIVGRGRLAARRLGRRSDRLPDRDGRGHGRPGAVLRCPAAGSDRGLDGRGLRPGRSPSRRRRGDGLGLAGASRFRPSGARRRSTWSSCRSTWAASPGRRSVRPSSAAGLRAVFYLAAAFWRPDSWSRSCLPAAPKPRRHGAADRRGAPIWPTDSSRVARARLPGATPDLATRGRSGTSISAGPT